MTITGDVRLGPLLKSAVIALGAELVEVDPAPAARVDVFGVPLGAAAKLELARIGAELRAAGVSCARIAATLQAEGAPARGARWHATTVARMVAA